MKVSPSDRLCYALMTNNDADLLYQLNQDPSVMKYINDGKPISREEMRNIHLPRMESFTNTSKGWGLWKAVVTLTSEFVGWILVRPMDYFSDEPQYQNIELGWRFTQKSWGKGYATEAAETVKNALIQTGDATKLSAIALEENLSSINIMKKLEMKYIKTDTHQDPLGDMEVVYYEFEIAPPQA